MFCRIVSDGTPHGTHVYDVETGREIGVFEIDWHFHINEGSKITVGVYSAVQVEGKADVITICPRCRAEVEAGAKP